MKFVDEAKIYIRSGDGGKGCVSFRREKYVPRGGPDGGDGGKGGDIVVKSSRNHHTLLDMKYNQHHIAKRGGHGSGSNKTGKNAEDLEIIVPTGTIVSDAETGGILADLTEDDQRSIVARGGIGGRGNARFATSTNKAPRYAQDGIPGEERWIHLELKLLADVGITGLPNVGKSTFISRISAAKPKIADYPFTTLTPNLGIVKFGDYESFAVADIPGLIEGAHLGAGLGIKFLRHIERTSLLLHIIDISKENHDSGWEDFKRVNNELVSFSPAMIEKPQVVAINKIDLPVTKERIKAESNTFEKEGITIFPISAVTGEGIKDLIGEIVNKLKTCGVL
ncbi:MAG: GTPase ObgE [Thermodesulfobacteriota bacterium]|nr:GTPase ObgE [Thermodesulfobacteriota bacterium]